MARALTLGGVAPPAPISAPSPTSRGGVPSGRYRIIGDALDVPALDLDPPQINSRILELLERQAVALKAWDIGEAQKIADEMRLLARREAALMGGRR